MPLVDAVCREPGATWPIAGAARSSPYKQATDSRLARNAEQGGSTGRA